LSIERSDHFTTAAARVGAPRPADRVGGAPDGVAWV